MSSASGRTIREAIAVALEAVPGNPKEWAASAEQLAALRAHLMLWAHEYAMRRGVILADADVYDEIDAIIIELSSTGRTATHQGKDTP